MTHRIAVTRSAKNLIKITSIAACLFAAPTLPHAADSSLAAPLCGVLKKLVPEVKAFKPEGARAQLVMAIGEKFDYDAAKLRQVKTQIDQATSASCPKDRDSMLGILKMKSLAEAVS